MRFDCTPRMAGSQTPHWWKCTASYIYSVEEAAGGLYPGSRRAVRRAGELNKGDTMKALVVAVLNALSSAPVADVRRSGQQRGNAR